MSAPWRARLIAWLPTVAVLALLTAVWYVATYAVLDPSRRFLLPPPHDVITESFLDGAHRAELLRATWQSVRVAATGLVVAAAVGIATAVVMSQSRALERALFPVAIAVQSVPILAIAPVIGFWFGFDFRSRVLVCVLIAVFPILANALFGFTSAPQGAHDLFTLHGATRWDRIVRLQLPAALPALFAGLRIAAGLSVVGAVVGDLIFRQGEPGLGTLIDRYRGRLQSEQLFGAILLTSALGIAVFALFGLAARLVIGRWHTPTRG